MVWIIIAAETLAIGILIARMLRMRSNRPSEEKSDEPKERGPEVTFDLPQEENWDQPAAGDRE